MRLHSRKIMCEGMASKPKWHVFAHDFAKRGNVVCKGGWGSLKSMDTRAYSL